MTLVEAAITLPVVLLLMFGAIDAARYIATQNAVNTVAHEAARYGSSIGTGPSGDNRYVECDAIRTAGIGLAAGISLVPSDITVEYDGGPATVVTATCPVGGPGPASSSISDGDRVVVTVAGNFDALSPWLKTLDGSVTAVSRRTILSP